MVVFLSVGPIGVGRALRTRRRNSLVTDIALKMIAETAESSRDLTLVLTPWLSDSVSGRLGFAMRIGVLGGIRQQASP